MRCSPFFTSFLLYVGQVYWLQEARRPARIRNARTLFMVVGLSNKIRNSGCFNKFNVIICRLVENFTYPISRLQPLISLLSIRPITSK